MYSHLDIRLIRVCVRTFIRMCGEKTTVQVVTSDTNLMSVLFFSDASYVDRGFSAEYEAFASTDRESQKNIKKKHSGRDSFSLTVLTAC